MYIRYYTRTLFKTGKILLHPLRTWRIIEFPSFLFAPGPLREKESPKIYPTGTIADKHKDIRRFHS